MNGNGGKAAHGSSGISGNHLKIINSGGYIEGGGTAALEVIVVSTMTTTAKLAVIAEAVGMQLSVMILPLSMIHIFKAAMALRAAEVVKVVMVPTVTI